MKKWQLIPVLISLGALAWVGWELTRHGVWREPWPRVSWAWIAAVIALMPVNWGLEVAKWRFLQPGLAWGQAAREVLMGAMAAFLTPNRLGDVAGRVAAAPPERQALAGRAFATSAGAQWLMTAGVGIVALGNWWAWALPPLALAVFFQWSPRLPRAWRERWAWLQSEAIPVKQRAGALGLSAVRYAVFWTQFWLAFRAVDLAPKWNDIPLIFLGNAFVPSAALGELGVREAVTLAVMRPEGAAVGAAAVAAFAVWAVNLVVPAAVGALLNLQRR